jgi:glycerol uptake facilitator-like aquaporin
VISAPVLLWRRLAAEFLGSAFLAAVVIGSGIAAQRLSPGNTGLQLLENAAATAAGLFAIILMFGPVSGGRGRRQLMFALARSGRLSSAPAAVGGYIGAAYWFTSSTSFANPAITIGRMFSNTFAGIAPSPVPVFIAAQIGGGIAGVLLIRVLYPALTPAQAAGVVAGTKGSRSCI